MTTEIERKFLVHATPELQQLLETAPSKYLAQGYLEPGVNVIVRVDTTPCAGTNSGVLDVVVADKLRLRVLVPVADACEIEEFLCVDGVVSADKHPTVRVRISQRNMGVLTLKGRGDGLSRPEFEYEIDVADAVSILTNYSSSVIAKTRYMFGVAGTDLTWELDVFEGANTGLAIAEVEMPTPDTVVPAPAWLSDEVTYQPEFTNASLARYPFSQWSAASRSNVPDTTALQSITHTTPEPNMPTPETTLKINTVIADKLGVDITKIIPEAELVKDLGADSLDQVEVVMALEDEFNLEIPDQDAEKLVKISDIYAYITEHIDA